MRTTCLVIALLLLACGDDDAGQAAMDASAPHADAGHDAAPPSSSEPDAGGDAGQPAASDAGNIGDFGASDVCSECLGRECRTEASSCLEREACTSLVDCARGCSSSDAGDCRVACLDAHRTGGAPYNDLVLCMGQRCRAECPFSTP